MSSPTTAAPLASQTTPNSQQRYTVSAADLPLSCPTRSMAVWSSHPRVYLPIEKTGSAKCPYCGAEYTLAR